MILSSWVEFALAVGVVTASHFLPRRGGLRETLIGRISRRPNIAGYGIISLLVLFWLIGSPAGRRT